MPILSITSTGATNSLKLRLQLAQAQLGPAIADAIMACGEHAAQSLADAAPKGASPEDGSPLDGDAPGPLSGSFENAPVASDTTHAATQVITTQPAKLALVRSGHGEVRPVRARALMWPGLDHPVRRAGPVAPNEFVDPVWEQEVDYAREQLQAAVTTTLSDLQG